MDHFYDNTQPNNHQMNNNNHNNYHNLKFLKNKMTLDFNSPASHDKKAKLKTCILESPDLKMLKLASPELERMIIQQNSAVTPTPTVALPYFLKQEQEPTDEQEQYAKGFVDALNQLHQTNGIPSAPTNAPMVQPNQRHTMSAPITIPVSVPVSTPMSTPMVESRPRPPSPLPSRNISLSQPIDMADQERIKLERKRLRNRIAASKCRRRKLERISKLEDKVKILKSESSELSIVVNKLRDQACALKQQIMDHVKCGCQLMVPQ